MNKLSLVAVVASLALAAPALAQTPSDIRNGRTGSVASSSEVKIDHHSSAAHGSTSETKDAGEEHHGKKHHGKKHHAKKHHGKKHHHKGEAKAEAAPATTEKK